MSETVRTPHELEQQAPLALGFDYEKFDAPDVWAGRVMVPVVRTPEKTTYLVAINGQNEERWKERVQVLGVNDIPCHLLPSKTDQYSEQESQFARETLGQSPGEIRTPYAPRMRKKEALVFDTTSVKSVLDVMIATGQDSADIRKARLAALHGETNDVVDTLQSLLEFGAYADAEDVRADALQVAYDLYNKPASIDIIEQLTEKGTESFHYKSIQERVAEGVDPKLVESTVTNPESVQQVATEGWKQMIEFAHENNRDISHNGIYTELHKVGDVLIALPAIASTAWVSRGQSLGYVHVAGEGHTLAEMYESTFTDRKGLSYESKAFIDDSLLLQLSKKLGTLASGERTLQRRCLTTFDEQGDPVIHIRESDPYTGRRGKMTNEEIMTRLSNQAIRSDVVSKKGMVVKTGHEFEKPIVVNVKQLNGMYEESRFSDDRPIACLTNIDIGPQVVMTWTYGYAPSHEELFKRTNSEEDGENGIAVTFNDGESVRLRATYVGHEDEIEGSQQFVLWSFGGDKTVIDKHASELKAMIEKADHTLASHMASVWDVSPHELYAETWLDDRATGKYGSFSLE